jgi:hypothetical protein
LSYPDSTNRQFHEAADKIGVGASEQSGMSEHREAQKWAFITTWKLEHAKELCEEIEGHTFVGSPRHVCKSMFTQSSKMTCTP